MAKNDDEAILAGEGGSQEIGIVVRAVGDAEAGMVWQRCGLLAGNCGDVEAWIGEERIEDGLAEVARSLGVRSVSRGQRKSGMSRKGRGKDAHAHDGNIFDEVGGHPYGHVSFIDKLSGFCRG